MTQAMSGTRPFGAVCGLALALFLGVATPRVVGGQSQETGAPVAIVVPPPPAQPIAFSHRRHVTEVGLDCQLCHVYARRSPVAGIPSVQTCAGCHQQVLADRPEVQKVLAFWEAEQPIPWVRVHDLPDYARFSHKRHLLGGLSCAECHGDVGRMEVAEQVASLSMGWCVTCHEDRDAPLDCLTCHY